MIVGRPPKKPALADDGEGSVLPGDIGRGIELGLGLFGWGDDV